MENFTFCAVNSTEKAVQPKLLLLRGLFAADKNTF